MNRETEEMKAEIKELKENILGVLVCLGQLTNLVDQMIDRKTAQVEAGEE